MIIQGRNPVLELLKAEKTVEKIVMEKGAQGTLAKIYAEARKRNIRVQFVERSALDRQSPDKRHQGVIAFTTDFVYSDLQEILSYSAEAGRTDSCIVLCDGIEDVHNLGSILRVAECAGADGVIIPSAKGVGVTETVVRISAGAAEHVKVAKVPSVNFAIEELKKAGYWIYGLEAGGESIYENRMSGKIALVAGGEDSGVRRLTKEKCDKIVSLPLLGKVNSLNVSVAVGIALYEAVRARLGK